jgi:Tfp pilus assembly protein PilO
VKSILIALVIVAILVVGYLKLTAHDEQLVGQQKQERETLINDQEKKLMQQSKQMGQQMQNDVDNKMKVLDKTTDGKGE